MKIADSKHPPSICSLICVYGSASRLHYTCQLNRNTFSKNGNRKNFGEICVVYFVKNIFYESCNTLALKFIASYWENVSKIFIDALSIIEKCTGKLRVVPRRKYRHCKRARFQNKSPLCWFRVFHDFPIKLQYTLYKHVTTTWAFVIQYVYDCQNIIAPKENKVLKFKLQNYKIRN